MDEEFLPIPPSDLQKVLEFIFEKKLIKTKVRCIEEKGIIIQFQNMTFNFFDNPEPTFHFEIRIPKKIPIPGSSLIMHECIRKNKVENLLKYCSENNLIHFEVNYDVWKLIYETDLKPAKK
jgi:hypothetical protein